MVSGPIEPNSSTVPSGRRVGDELVGDVAPRAALVVDHHRLADVGCQLFRDQAGGRIGGAAGRKTHHQRDRFLGGKSWACA